MISDIEISLKEMIGRRKVYISPEKAWNGPSLKSLIKQQLKKLQAWNRRLKQIAAEPEPQETTDSERDAGVSDAVWEELEVAKREYHERMSREWTEEEAWIEAEKQAKIQEQIRQICPCPAGYLWFKLGCGWKIVIYADFTKKKTF